MEERGSAHRLTQRLLEDPDSVEETPVDPPDPVHEAEPGPRLSNTAAPPTTPALPLGPSDTLLRERQQAWRRERDRFEVAKAKRAAAEAGSR